MDWIWIVAVYLAIGVIRAISHLSSGKVGVRGVLATFVTVTLIWPILFFTKTKGISVKDRIIKIWLGVAPFYAVFSFFELIRRTDFSQFGFFGSVGVCVLHLLQAAIAGLLWPFGIPMRLLGYF